MCTPPSTVRYGETDMMGVVYHANYLLYFEDARIDFLDALDFSYSGAHRGSRLHGSPIHDMEMHYKAPLRYGEAGRRAHVGREEPADAHGLPPAGLPCGGCSGRRDGRRDRRRSDAEGAAALGRREPSCARAPTPLVDALVTVCVVERDTFKPVSLRHTFPDLYAKYEDIVEEA